MNKTGSIKSADHLLQNVLQLDEDSIEEFVRKLTEFTDLPAEFEREGMQEECVTLACSMYEMRRLRNRYLSASILGEPVWDMLLRYIVLRRVVRRFLFQAFVMQQMCRRRPRCAGSSSWSRKS